MRSHFIQHQSASHLKPILPQGYPTGSQALDGQYNLNYHPRSQNTPHTTKGYMSAGKFSPYLREECMTRLLLMLYDKVTPHSFAVSQTPACHCVRYLRSSSTPTAASCYLCGQQRSRQNLLWWRQQQRLVHSQLGRGYEAMPPEVITSPDAQTLNPLSQMTQHTGQPAGMTDSSGPKIESQVHLQLQKSLLSSVGQAHYEQDVGELQGSANTAPARDTKAAPGSIPATTPLVVRRDGNGVQWIAFEFSTNRVKMKYTIRCDVESVDIDELSPEFKEPNCVYPQVCGPRDQYQGKSLVHETECNDIAWALAELNVPLRGKRGFIQPAVDSWA
ncbi:hypothetical protein FPRO04_12284 [Fusarium proliferatum]|nr:hypothetical protein FPRO04_12284 [Fusarium proliferatum]